ncbi:hypothetical protein NEOKW01_0912 [Nematocida sp. AWRm80]|nr:hypothetical protein NEOKW01_0912 [Nematocida sp. AWRm80]
MLNRLSLGDILKPRHAFILSGLLFIGMGLFLFDSHLIKCGNIVLSIGVIMGISSLRNIIPMVIFVLGSLCALVTPKIGIMIEIVSFVLWGKNKILYLIGSPFRLVSSLGHKEKGDRGK